MRAYVPTRDVATSQRSVGRTGGAQDYVLLSELAPFVDAEKLAWVKSNAPVKSGVADGIDIEAFVQSSFST